MMSFIKSLNLPVFEKEELIIERNLSLNHQYRTVEEQKFKKFKKFKKIKMIDSNCRKIESKILENCESLTLINSYGWGDEINFENFS